jgi:hypothetical protein
MAESRNLEYCVLRYVPNAIGKEGVLLAAIFIYPGDPDKETCAITFAPHWQEKVQLFDPDSDLEMIEATLVEIQDRLRSPTSLYMLDQLEDSFSNIIQISDRKKCPLPANSRSVWAFAQALLGKTSTGSPQSPVLHSAAYQV